MSSLLATMEVRGRLTPTGCLLWTGRVDKDGYGIMTFRKAKLRVRRQAYIERFGPIPKGKVVISHWDKRCFARGHSHLGKRGDELRAGKSDY